MVEWGTRQGQSVAIYGAGPSLIEAPHDPGTDERWACNSALPYLMDRGAPVTHGITLDQGTIMLGPQEWFRTFDVEYLLASTVHPELVQHLAKEGRRWRFFHSLVGMDAPPGWQHPDPDMTFESFLYRRLYPTSVLVGHGLNTGTRALCLALVMGFERIEVYGLDCCTALHTPMPPRDHPDYRRWLDECVFYGDGRTVGQVYGPTLLAEAEFDGVLYHTRPDMVASALSLLHLQQTYPDRITYHGTTLLAALSRHAHEPDFLDRMPLLSSDGTISNFGHPTAFAQGVAA
jgi:hypothetical protein